MAIDAGHDANGAIALDSNVVCDFQPTGSPRTACALSIGAIEPLTTLRAHEVNAASAACSASRWSYKPVALRVVVTDTSNHTAEVASIIAAISSTTGSAMPRL